MSFPLPKKTIFSLSREIDVNTCDEKNGKLWCSGDPVAD